jgi:hypothetical protein
MGAAMILSIEMLLFRLARPSLCSPSVAVFRGFTRTEGFDVDYAPRPAQLS